MQFQCRCYAASEALQNRRGSCMAAEAVGLAAAAAESSGILEERLTAMTALADFTLRSSDGEAYRVHKVKLLEQSSVLRSLLSEISATELCLSETGEDVLLLITGMYAASMPFLTWDNMGTFLELARKYDVHDIWAHCTRCLRSAPLNVDLLPRVLRLAAAYGLDDLVARCQDAVAAGDMYEQLERKLGSTWYHDLPAAALATMVGKQRAELKRRKDRSDAGDHQEDWPSKAQMQAFRCGLNVGYLVGMVFAMGTVHWLRSGYRYRR